MLHVSSPQERLVAQLARIRELSGLSLRALVREFGHGKAYRFQAPSGQTMEIYSFHSHATPVLP